MTDRSLSKRHNKPLNLLCQQCDTRFTNDRFRMFCGHECKAKYYAELGKHLWSEEEESFILSLIGLYPIAPIVRKVKRQFKAIPTTVIRQKVEDLARKQEVYISERVDNLNIEDWARVLGINALRVHNWIKKGLTSRRSGKQHMITYGSMRKYASLHPQDLWGVSEESLKKLFPKPSHAKYIELILSAKPCKAPVRPVLCVTTNIVYLSLTKAEADTGISRNRISTAIKSGIPTQDSSGKYLAFKYAD